LILLQPFHIDSYYCYYYSNVCMVGSHKDSALSGTVWTVEELIDAAERIIAADPVLFSHPESETNKELNIRLIRDYVVREFIPRPERVGREGRFGLDHLVYLLAVRILLRSQKWSLPAIKASFAGTSSQELLNGLLAPVRDRIQAEYRCAQEVGQGLNVTASQVARTPDLNPAQLLIEQFKAGSRNVAPPKHMSNEFSSQLADAARAVPYPLPQPTAGTSRKLHLELEPWCEVVIDVQRMDSLTGEEVERLGEALKSRLKNESASEAE
jgi:hypothetical protein